MGSALVGLRPVIVHQRLDFMIYSLDAIVNWLSLWRFKSNGQSNMPVTIRAIVGKGWGQGPQHSKSLHAWFAHLPGIRVAVPTTPYDAKGLLLESIFGETPSIFIEGRALFSMNGEVPERPYRVRFGEAVVRRPGKDATVVAIGMMAPQAVRAATALATQGIDVEVIDLRTLTPWDDETVLDAVSTTRRLVVADPGWQSFGAAAEIVATISERLDGRLAAPPVRVTLPDSHTPMSSALEQEYYPSDEYLMQSIRRTLQ
jgi:pyruvate dehydrogenase E1 component beta subunit